MASLPTQGAHQTLLAARQEFTEVLRHEPYSILIYLERAHIHAELGYPDMAIMDIYKALMLADEVLDDSAEFHEQALMSATSLISTSARRRLVDALRLDPSPNSDLQAAPGIEGNTLPSDSLHTATTDDVQALVQYDVIPQASTVLAHHLISIGCLRTAYEYLQTTLRNTPGLAAAAAERDRILTLAHAHAESKNDRSEAATVNVDKLPDRGFVRREIYPWNMYEQDRMSSESLHTLNAAMKSVAPKVEAKIAELPLLSAPSSRTVDSTSQQLGLFATADIEPGEIILRERSLLTANAILHEPLCDACSASLPSLDETYTEENHGQSGPVTCSECADIVFCSQQCHELAQASYHASVCGTDVDAVGKDVPASQAVDALYTQLLLRALAMSSTQDKHPLALTEVRYIWGDFSTETDMYISDSKQGDNLFQQSPRTLAFDFRSQVLQPLQFLELLDINIFEAPNDLAEIWVYNTLFAKFRGTASARLSPRDGRPEVAAVHPLWCLANHSCDPNVEWEWGGEITFKAREKRVRWKRQAREDMVEEERPARASVIMSGQEILNHYVDVDLGVEERREWGAGALGGQCQCERCKWEACEDDAE